MMKLVAPVIKAAKNYHNKMQFQARFVYTKYYDTLSIDDNAVLVESFNGDDMNGSPFYILKELCENERYQHLKKYVTVHNGSRKRITALIEAQIDNHEDIVYVTKHSDEYCRLLASAKYLVTNVTFPTYFIKKDGQLYLNTWHGTPLKGLGRMMTDKPNTIGNVQRNLLMSDYIVCPSQFVCDVFKRDYMIDIFYQGDYVFEGYPQNAMLMERPEISELVVGGKTVDLRGKKIVVYMPTWREEIPGKPKNAGITYLNHALMEFDRRIDDDTIVLVKPHHLTKNKISWGNFEKIVRFPEEFETYQILALADILVTDYSSVMYDFLAAKRPVFLYTYDEKEYQASRNMYRSIDSLPFWHTDNMVDLCQKINDTPAGTCESYVDISNEYASYEDVQSAEKLCRLLIDNDNAGLKIVHGSEYHNGRENVLIYAGALLKNGITASLDGLLNTIDLSKRNYTLLFYQKATRNNVDTINGLPKDVRYIVIQGQQNMTLPESVARYRYFRLSNQTNGVMRLMSSLFSRERKRICPTCHFDKIIHFTGYERQLIHILNAFEGKKFIYVHNDMMAEYNARKNFHMPSNRLAYREWDGIAVVRESLVDSIANDFSVPTSKIYVVHNCNDINGIMNGGDKEVEFDRGTTCTKTLDELNDIYHKHDGPIFVNVARYSQEKGQKRLVDAFERYASTVNHNANLIIIGGHGDKYDEILEHVESNEYGNVTLVKSISNPHPLIKNADAMILSSFYEGLPMVIFEALILGTPVISTNIPGPCEFLSKGYGLVVDNSEDGIYSGFTGYENGKLESLTPFDAEKFNIDAVEEFSYMIE